MSHESLIPDVSRRTALKAGAVSAAALALPSVPGAQAASRTTSGTGWSGSDGSGGVQVTDLQFAFGHVKGVSELKLIAGGHELALVEHSAQSRAALAAQGGLWEVADLQRLSHHAPAVPLPADSALVVSVTGVMAGYGEVLVGQAWHVPRPALIAHARRALRSRRPVKAHPLGNDQQLALVGVAARRFHEAGLERAAVMVAQLATVVGPPSTAVAVTMMHPSIATKNPEACATTTSLLGGTPAVGSLGAEIATMAADGRPYARMVQATDPDGKPAKIKIDGQLTDLKTVRFAETESFKTSLKSAVVSGIRGVRDTASLGAVIDKPLDQDKAASTRTWVQSRGVLPQSKPAVVNKDGVLTRSHADASVPAPVEVALSRAGSWFGTEVKVQSGFGDDRKVSLKLYNNFVRWVWVYAQYLGEDGTNLSLNDNPTWPDTKYSQSLGLLPQVFTVLGVPLWDTNTIDVDLHFPTDAHTARILFCGLGADVLNHSGWRQYFPTDAYPGLTAPQDEVLFASITTGIISIAMTLFALVTDIDIASAWGPVRKRLFFETSGGAIFQIDELRSWLERAATTLKLGVPEAVALTVVSGAASYESFRANGNASNFWEILLPLGTVIPKILFSPEIVKPAKLFEVVNDALIQFSTQSIGKAVPLIGEALAVAAAVGDAITLAEVVSETLLCPWVIENEVSLQYDATVTISHDPADASFPKTARQWRLEATSGQTTVLDPVVGQVNEGGAAQSDPVVAHVTAPFGGTIQWSVVFLTESGVQVGAGMSDVLANDDPSNPPSEVEITIAEQAVPITATTVFERQVTTAWAPSRQGYVWSDAVNAAATVGSSEVDVAGVTVATALGVGGVVFQDSASKLFYVRGVPTVENPGETIQLGVGSSEGFARRPFLLFDTFAQAADSAGHVLLDPDPSGDGYLVRALDVDPVTGDLSWDKTTSLGMFTVPVSAAALHSSGQVVALNTDNGRVGWLTPVQTPQPTVASYTAGNGTQVGLLSSPVAVAVTNPGTVLVLEADAQQVSAFDLNGNPVPYFTAAVTRRRLLTRKAAGSQGQYTMALVSAGTYLDLGVDGSGQIYALYFTGSGSQPGDYHVDVYSADGQIIDTHSAGVNVPHLAVDYWRSIYGANYTLLRNLGTDSPHVDPKLKVPEPSLSRFDPNV